MMCVCEAVEKSMALYARRYRNRLGVFAGPLRLRLPLLVRLSAPLPRRFTAGFTMVQ